jgi:hypothetical protein
MTALASSSGIRLSTLDYIVSVMDSPQSPLDFTIVLRFNQKLDSDALRKGALSARNLFPTTGSHLRINRWVHNPSARSGIRFHTRTDDTVSTFVNRAIDLSHDLPVQQLITTDEAGNATTLITKFHHAVADGTSASLWLRHQLAVAFGYEEERSEASSFEPLHLKQLSTSVRRSKFAYSTPSDQLWTLPAQRSGIRAWTSINFEANELRRACRKTRGFTYSDLLATCALEMFSLWNREQYGDHTPRVALWLPINIRRRSDEGFGNGTSRIRIYASYPPGIPLIDKCREVRRQVSWCTSHGEWVVPQVPALTGLPRWVTGPILRRHLTRPSLDMATGVFSHVDGWNNNKELFNALQKIETIGLLHPFQALAVNGATHNGKTWLTFTYDTSQFEPQHVKRLVEIYLEQVKLAGRELE